jgi:hypothetical protein
VARRALTAATYAKRAGRTRVTSRTEGEPVQANPADAGRFAVVPFYAKAA